jgi:hypothetical protein
MERLAELLAKLDALTEIERDELDAMLEELSGPLTDEALDAGDVENLERIAAAVDSIREESTRRDEEAAAAEQATAELLERIRGAQASDTEPDGDPAEDDPPAEDEPDKDEPPAEVPAEEPAPEAKVPVAAAAAPARLPAAARRPMAARTRPRAADRAFAELGLIASANNGSSVEAGTRFTSLPDFADALTDAVSRARGYRGSSVEYAKLATMTRPDRDFRSGDVDLHLGMDPFANEAIFASAQQALTAAGGICLPLPAADLGLPTLGSTERPIRDQAMQRFGATAGGIRTIPSPTLAAVSAGVSVWTEAIDAAWTGVDPDDDTKPCAEVDCPTEVESVVDAIVTCLTYSNFRGRFNPTQIDAWLRLLAVWAARFSENRLLTTMTAGSTAVTGAAEVSALPDFITYNRQMVAGFRYRHRLASDAPMTVVVPRWAVDYLVSDMVRRMPGDGVNANLGATDADVRAILARHNINLVAHMDGLSGQIMAAQSAGVIVEYPTTIVEFIYPSGAWTFLDGGELNLGVVRDSTLNAINKAKFFSETFEAAHFRGPESLKATLTTLNKGTASALSAVTGG